MLGYANSPELLQKSIFDLTPVEEHERIKADIVVALKTGIIQHVEYVMLKRSGTTFG